MISKIDIGELEDIINKQERINSLIAIIQTQIAESGTILGLSIYDNALYEIFLLSDENIKRLKILLKKIMDYNV